MTIAKTNEWLKWLGLTNALVSIGTISYIKFRFVFESGNVAGKLVLLSLATSFLAALLGIYEFRRWQSWLSFVLVGGVVYIFLSPPVYVVP
jgi:hypothetical protein